MLYALTYLTCLRAFVHLHRTCLHFLCVLRAFRFSTCLTCLECFTFFIFYVPHLPSIFYVPSVLCACILFMYMLIKLTQINELTYDFSPFLLLNSVIYQRLLNIYTSIKLVIFWMIFSFFERKNINYFSYWREKPTFWKTGTLFGRRNPGMLKSFKIRRNKKIFTGIFDYIFCWYLLTLIFSDYIFSLFYLVPACSSFLWLVRGCSTFYKKAKA